jgi:primary-amine oxidase
VGPLPPDETTEVLPLSFCYNSGRNYVLNPMAEQEELQKWAIGVAMNASDITLELLGAVSLHKNALL